jgi:oligopeptide transport system substrate-binding protein
MVRILITSLFFITSAMASSWNSPHVLPKTANVSYGAFATAPKTLDPARAYSSNEIQFIAQIYEPPLQYHFLERPYRLVPLAASVMPDVAYFTKAGVKLPSDVNPHEVAYSVYTITIKKGVHYQPHPAFAKKQDGSFVYHALNEEDLGDVYALSDFDKTGTRELTAADYVYQIKRLAHPGLSSPIFGLMSEHIVGLGDYARVLRSASKKAIRDNNDEPFLDLRLHPLEGVHVLSRYQYQIKIKGVYPQFLYWLSMPFFAPIPWEADLFYAQPGMSAHNISWDWYPVGTGPYTLSENDPNKQMVLSRNPNFHGELYPGTNEALPYIDQFIFSLDKESIPRWNKFLQGYYDRASVGSDSFDQVVQFDKYAKPVLTDEMKSKGVILKTSVNPSSFYLGFNMLDPVVGGYSAKQKALRQAIAIGLDYEEYISIFMNGRGVPAQGPLPPGIFGYEQGALGVNPLVYDWVDGHAQRKSINEARALLIKAGYPNGIDPTTGLPLVLNFDVAGSGSPDEQAYFNWLRQQFHKLGISLNVRATQYNRFQDKMRKGMAQIFSWGWNADYPDPENFLFLLYGPNGKAEHGGENAANYHNPRVDRLFEAIRLLPNGPSRLEKIREITKIIREDSPWLFGLHPVTYSLTHQWSLARPAHAMANNTLKYAKLNPAVRSSKRQEWNRPIMWPLIVVLLAILFLILPVCVGYWRRERRSAIKRKPK